MDNLPAKTALSKDSSVVIREANGEEISVDRRLVQKIVNAVGIKMIKYKYWLLKTKDQSYKITDPENYRRIVRALNVKDVRFITINGDLINVMSIENIREKTGCKEIKEAK